MTTPIPAAESAPTLPAVAVAVEASVDVAIDPKPSWHGPVATLTGRVDKLEGGFVRLEAKTDMQTVMLGEIKGMLTSPRARWIALAIAGAAYAYAKAHHVTIPFLEDSQ